MSRLLRFVVALTLLAFAGSSIGKAAAGDVVLMPDRDAVTTAAVVIWGNTNAGNIGMPYTINFGDATPPAAGVVTDPSYISVTHTFATPGVKTVTMTVGADSDTATIEVFDPSTLSAENQRNVRINMAIEDGLRYLYVSQNNRQATYGTPFTSWTVHGGIYGFDPEFTLSYTSLVVLALENHGHTVTDDATQDIFQPVVQRGLNHIFNNLQQIPLGPQPSGDPCVGVPAGPDACVGLGLNGGHGMYASSVIALAVAGSGAPTAVVGPAIGAANGLFVSGRTYAEILQRQANTIMWGMGDSGSVRGGFGYVHNHQIGDGSTAGWGVLALLDAEAAGATIAPWVRPDVSNYASNGLQADGSLMYQVECCGGSNFPKTGIALQLMHFINRPAADPQAVSAANLLSTHWATGYTTDGFTGANKDHAYGMFNAFKGLKLRGIQTLPGVGRPAGPGSIPADDWHADYQDHLVATQQLGTDPNGGFWNFSNGWSYCGTCDLGGGVISFTAIAELILSPVALVLPANLTLSPETATNPVGTSHTVTAVATAANGAPVAGATVTFTVTAGPNVGQSGTDVTDATGTATFTYTSNGAPGTDTISASIGELTSEAVSKTWELPNDPPVCSATEPITLWSPNHELVAITLSGASDPDGDVLTLSATAIWQDEPLNTVGDGNTSFDATLDPVQVRAERTGNKKVPGDGRVYYIDFTATDPSGASCTGTVLVCVPHDQSGGQCVPGGRLFPSTP
jgi:hypothetical protein